MTTVRIASGGNPILSVRDWELHAPPKGGEGQWKAGRSAKELAIAWCGGDSSPEIPPDVLLTLESHPEFSGVQELDLVPEAHIHFDSFGGPRNADLAGTGTGDHGQFAVTVEAKADETFDRLVSVVATDARSTLDTNPRSNALTRVNQLMAAILPAGADTPANREKLRYQLLTAVAGTLKLAEEKRLDRALLLVHEFVTSETRDEKHEANADDLDFFVKCLSDNQINQIPKNKIVGPIHIHSSALFQKPAALYIGKVVTCQRESRYAPYRK